MFFFWEFTIVSSITFRWTIKPSVTFNVLFLNNPDCNQWIFAVSVFCFFCELLFIAHKIRQLQFSVPGNLFHSISFWTNWFFVVVIVLFLHVVDGAAVFIIAIAKLFVFTPCGNVAMCHRQSLQSYRIDTGKTDMYCVCEFGCILQFQVCGVYYFSLEIKIHGVDFIRFS